MAGPVGTAKMREDPDPGLGLALVARYTMNDITQTSSSVLLLDTASLPDVVYFYSVDLAELVAEMRFHSWVESGQRCWSSCLRMPD